MRAAILFAAVFAVLALPAQASADELLTRLDGRWTGSGWSQATADAARDVLRCKLAITLSASRDRADIRGKCATPGKSYDMRSFIARQSDGSYSGQWSNPGGEGAANLTGTRSGDRLVMRYDGRHPDTKRRIAGTMTWRIGTDSISLSNTVTDIAGAQTWKAGEMTFGR